MNRPNAAPLAVWGLAAGFSIGCGAPPVDSGATSARESLQPFQLLIDWQVEPTYLGIYLALERGHFERRPPRRRDRKPDRRRLAEPPSIYTTTRTIAWCGR